MVSIILPNLNTPLNFLFERINSITSQTFTDWQCIVIDGFSVNGSWELIQQETAEDSRFRYYQKPAKGIYDAWNEGIKLAEGEYIYIATSDDLCDKNFLVEMVGVLEANPDCGLAHCCLNIIDENGNLTAWQWRDWEKVQFYGDYISRYHKRSAPYDALVHFGWNTVYTSVVQLLIRKTVFEQNGYFNTGYGSVADFEWGLRTSLNVNVVHVPLYLASWRRYAGQATQDNFINSSAFYTVLIKMCTDALTHAKHATGVKLRHTRELYFNYLLKQFNLTVKDQKIKFLTNHLRSEPYLILKVLMYHLLNIRFDADVFLRKQLKKRNLDKLLSNLN